MGDGDLENRLENGTQGALGFMPELLETVVAGIPFPCIEQGDCVLKARIGLKFSLLVDLGWILAGG